MRNVQKRLKRLLVLAIALVFVAGCAGLRGAATGDTHRRVGELEEWAARLQTGKADKSEVAKIAAAQEKTAELLKATSENLTALKGTVDGHGTAITGVNERLTKADDWAKTVVAALDGFKTGQTKLGRDIAGVRTVAVRVTERAGESEDRAGVDGAKDIVKFGPFVLAKYDDKEKKFTACAEVPDAMKKQIERAKKHIEDGGYEIEKVVGGADVRKVHGKDGKVLANSDELNEECAKLRAQAVAEALGFDEDQAIGRGPTASYGEPYDLNRMVRVYLKKK